jgi:hypothetical protein
MKAMRARRRAEGLRDVRVAEQVARLSPVAEAEALDRIEAVSEFDEAR